MKESNQCYSISTSKNKLSSVRWKVQTCWNRRIKINIILFCISIKLLPGFTCADLVDNEWVEWSRDTNSSRKENRKHLFPCLLLRQLIKNAPKQKVQITFSMINLQVTPLGRHFYGNGSILIQHWLNPVRFNTMSIHKRNFCLPKVKTGSLG